MEFEIIHLARFHSLFVSTWNLELEACNLQGVLRSVRQRHRRQKPTTNDKIVYCFLVDQLHCFTSFLTIARDQLIQSTIIMKSSFASAWSSLLLVLWYWSTAIHALRHLEIASPLQSLTIPEHDDATITIPLTARGRFLQKIQAGLRAEQQLVQQQQETAAQDTAIAVDTSKQDWAHDASSQARRRQLNDERMLEEAFDKAVAPYDEQLNNIQRQQLKQKKQHKYQLVGVIQPQQDSQNKNSKPIQWYARLKPANSHWSVRLIHVNQDAAVYDLFRRGRVDLLGKYDNTGITDETTGLPVIRSHYAVRERSWKYVLSCLCVVLC